MPTLSFDRSTPQGPTLAPPAGVGAGPVRQRRGNAFAASQLQGKVEAPPQEDAAGVAAATSEQQEAATCDWPAERDERLAPLAAPDWAALFDGDSAYQEKIRAIATQRAKHAFQKSTKGTVPDEHARALDAARARAARRIAESETELSEEEQGAVDTDERAAAELHTLRYEFIRVAQMPAHPVNKVRSRLNKAFKTEAKKLDTELKRVKRKKGDDTEIVAELCALRASYQQQLDAEVAQYKQWFLTSAEEQLRFDSDRENAALPGSGAREPGAAAKAAAVPMPRGLGSGPIGPGLIPFLQAWKAALRDKKIHASFQSYGEKHNWGPFSVDLWVAGWDTEAFMDEDVADAVFATLKDCAAAAGVRWQALYNDFDVAKKANAANKAEKVRFQWLHGPGPYKPHVHLDLEPPRN
jgi:hypothetical protein